MVSVCDNPGICVADFRENETPMSSYLVLIGSGIVKILSGNRNVREF